MSAGLDWPNDAFFGKLDRGSLDGGTTSVGHLWHSVSPRWGHAMHTMCSYHGMFPAKVAHYFIQRYSRPGDLVLDPFSGRGTTALQARVEGRKVISNDLNPLAYVLSRAKNNPPPWEEIHTFVNVLETEYKRSKRATPNVSPDIRMLYHENTLKQLCYIRERLLSKKITAWSREELMLAGSLAGIMHGSWRRGKESSQYLSISMPNTFSMSPAYVEKFIREKDLKKIDQDVFERLRDKIARLYLDDVAGLTGKTYHADAAKLLTGGNLKARSVDLIITSPPYLQVVNYGTANWIRLWLLGIDEVGRERGAGRKKLDAELDHRHTYSSYRAFMLRTVLGAQRVLKPSGVAVLIIGDVADPGKEPVPLARKLWDDIKDDTGLRLVESVEDDLPAHNKVSRIWRETKGQATNRDCALVLAHREGKPDLSRAEIDWDEPYKDGGPDAAHERLRNLRLAL